ncbi:MAG TPA: hypothetical protein VFG69_03675 [Nannocystaceae bacterium]|nr:hypothetical protein [Nannocystaceae bacterium]
MRHHFGDELDREGGYWKVVPNRERYAYRIGDVPAGSTEVTIVTIGKEDENWRRALTLPNLEELTLHEPTKEQLGAIGALRAVQRLRITHARPKTLDVLSTMTGIEELVLEYVSGFHDLSPLRALPRLRALHIENVRAVRDFGGLAGAAELRYLAIHGTLDWNQPIADFEFLRDLPRLEVLRLWQVICRAPYPAMLPAIGLRRLKELRLHGSYLAAEEYALLEEALPGVEGACWGPYRRRVGTLVELPRDDVRAHLPEADLRSRHPEIWVGRDGTRLIEDAASRWIEFTGKGAGGVRPGSTTEDARCRAYAERYAAMKQQARALLQAHRGEVRSRR